MKSFLKNIALLVIVLILSYFTATWFGKIYDYFSPLYDRSIFALTKDQLIPMTGGPFAYVFFLVLIFSFFGFKEKKNWIIWLLVPALLFFGSGDIKHIYLPIILGLIAFGLAYLLRKIFRIKV